jgi:hypothetical protein
MEQTVHGVVAANHRGHPRAGCRHFHVQKPQVFDATGGRGIASIGEGVDEDVLHARLVRRFGQCDEVIDMAVHAAVADESQEMQPPPRLPGTGEGVPHDGIVIQRALGECLGNAGQILINDASGAEIEVAHFRIAHLALGQADIQAAGAQAAMRVSRQEMIVKRRLAQHGGIAVAFGAFGRARIDAPTVADDENDRIRHDKAG